MLPNVFIAKAENPPQLESDERVPETTENTERKFVLNMIRHPRPCGTRLECVGMKPLPVRSLQLLVGKSMGRLPKTDPRAPALGNSSNPQLVVD